MYNDLFTTVLAGDPNLEENVRQWENLLTLPNNRLQVLLDEDEDPFLQDHWLTKEEIELTNQQTLNHAQSLISKKRPEGIRLS